MKYMFFFIKKVYRQNIASFNMTVNVENNDRKRKNKEFK